MRFFAAFLVCPVRLPVRPAPPTRWWTTPSTPWPSSPTRAGCPGCPKGSSARSSAPRWAGSTWPAASGRVARIRDRPRPGPQRPRRRTRPAHPRSPVAQPRPRGRLGTFQPRRKHPRPGVGRARADPGGDSPGPSRAGRRGPARRPRVPRPAGICLPGPARGRRNPAPAAARFAPPPTRRHVRARRRGIDPSPGRRVASGVQSAARRGDGQRPAPTAARPRRRPPATRTRCRSRTPRTARTTARSSCARSWPWGSPWRWRRWAARRGGSCCAGWTAGRCASSCWTGRRRARSRCRWRRNVRQNGAPRVWTIYDEPGTMRIVVVRPRAGCGQRHAYGVVRVCARRTGNN